MNVILGLLFVAVVYVVAFVVGAVPLYFAWNVVMPPLFDLPALTFGQAVGMCVLLTILTTLVRNPTTPRSE